MADGDDAGASDGKGGGIMGSVAIEAVSVSGSTPGSWLAKGTKYAKVSLFADKASKFYAR